MYKQILEVINDIEILVGEMAKVRNEIEDHLLEIDIKQKPLIESESKIYSAAYEIRKQLTNTPSQEWHPASDQPDTKDGWFLAVTKDNQPFLTHYINGWVAQVYQWTYIFLPRNT